MKHITWNKKSHEAGVENFYGKGVERYGEFHGGYLNFGLWETGIKNYLEAAENLVLRMGKLAGLESNSRLLDVASGMGTQDILLQKKFGCTINTLDVTWKHVERTRERILKNNLASFITANHGTATALPFHDNSFTNVMSIEGPEHFDTREAFFHEAYRVLQYGGVITLADYNLDREPRNIYEHFVVEAARILWHVPKENYDTVASYQAKLEKTGFRNVHIERVGELTIPGYYFEQKRPETIAGLKKIRGRLATWGGFLIDYAVYKAFKDGLINYMLVRAEK